MKNSLTGSGPARRTFLAAGAARAGAALAGPLRANPPAVKGKAVWRDMDQAALDKAYDQAAWAPNIETLIARC